MMLRGRKHPLCLLIVGALCASGCATLSMKPPDTKLKLRSVAVQGHDPNHARRDSELQIGSASVVDVGGTAIYPPGLTAYGRMPEQTRWDYHFKVQDGAGGQRGECVEQVGEVRYYGLGETTLDVNCRCFVGQNQTAELNITRGEGKATLLPAHRFAVYGTRGSKQGKHSREILGYRFQSGKSLGAVDVTKASGAYYADNLSRDEQDALTCLYAGILLHREKR
jgi:hypothetical protein